MHTCGLLSPTHQTQTQDAMQSYARLAQIRLGCVRTIVVFMRKRRWNWMKISQLIINITNKHYTALVGQFTKWHWIWLRPRHSTRPIYRLFACRQNVHYLGCMHWALNSLHKTGSHITNQMHYSMTKYKKITNLISVISKNKTFT